MAAGGTAASSHGSRGSAAALELSLDRRFQVVSNTMESIQGLSTWCIDNKKYHNNIVRGWLKWIKQSEVPHRLNLFYLANDVIQNCKRRNAIVYRTSFTTVLPDAMDVFSAVDEPKVRNAVERTLTIWEERNVYSEEFITQLRNQLQEKEPEEPAVATPVETPTATPKVTAAQKSKIVAEFVPHAFIQKLGKFRSSVDEVELREKQLAAMRVDVCSTEALKKLKDKAGGRKFAKDFEEGSAKLQEFVSILEGQVKKGPLLLEALTNADVFYEMQYKEVKVVTKAYETFANRVNHLKRKLDSLKENLPSMDDSPLPSPCADAPSPAGSESPYHGNMDLDGVAMDDTGTENLIHLGDAPSPLSSAGGSPKWSPVMNPVGQLDNIEVEDMEMSDGEDSDGGGIIVEEPVEIATPIVPVVSNPAPTPAVTQPAVASKTAPSSHQATPSMQQAAPSQTPPSVLPAAPSQVQQATPLLQQAAVSPVTTASSSSAAAPSLGQAAPSLYQAAPTPKTTIAPSSSAVTSALHQTVSTMHQTFSSMQQGAPSLQKATSSPVPQVAPSMTETAPLHQAAPSQKPTSAPSSSSAVTPAATHALPPGLANVDLGKISSILNSIMKNSGGSRPSSDPPASASKPAPPQQSSAAPPSQSSASLASILSKVDTNTILSALSKTQSQGGGLQGFSSILNSEGMKMREKTPATSQPPGASFPAPSKDSMTSVSNASSLTGKQGPGPSSSFTPKQAPADKPSEKPAVQEKATPSNLDSRLHSFFQNSQGLAAFGIDLGLGPRSGSLGKRAPGAAPTTAPAVGQSAVSNNSPSLGQENRGGTPVRDESGGTPTQDEAQDDASGNIISTLQGGLPKPAATNPTAPVPSGGQPAPAAHGTEFWRNPKAPNPSAPISSLYATPNGRQFQQVDYNGMGKVGGGGPSNPTAVPHAAPGGGLPPDSHMGPGELRRDPNLAEGGWYGQQQADQQGDGRPAAVGGPSLNYGRERPGADPHASTSLPARNFFNTPLPPIPSLPLPPFPSHPGPTKDIVPGSSSSRLDHQPSAEPRETPNHPEEYPPHLGPPHSGPTHHGPPQPSHPNHGPPHPGQPSHGPPHPGQPSHGPPHPGPPSHGPPHSGPPHPGPPHPGVAPHGPPQHDPLDHDPSHFEPSVREDMLLRYPEHEEGLRHPEMRHPDEPPFPHPHPYDHTHPHHRPPGPELDPMHPDLDPRHPDLDPRHPELDHRHPHHLPRRGLSPPPGPMGDYYDSRSPPRPHPHPPVRPGYYDDRSPSPPPFEDPYYDRYYDREARSPSPPPFPYRRPPLSPHALPPEYDLPPDYDLPPEYDLPPDYDPYDLPPPPHHRHPPHPFHPRPPRPMHHMEDMPQGPPGPRRPPPHHHPRHPHGPHHRPMKRPGPRGFGGPPRGGGPFFPPKRPYLPPRF